MSKVVRAPAITNPTGPAALASDYLGVRRESHFICEPLLTEDYCIQSMPDVSPPKWHLAHTSWFFETFLLRPFASGYAVFDAHYDHLFNSYYETIGSPFPRTQRGMLARPAVTDIYRYRAHVDDAMQQLLTHCPAEHEPAVAARTVLGLHHEQQHQELLLTDIKHIFALNPLRPAYRQLAGTVDKPVTPPLNWRTYPGGVREIGNAGAGFAFDNETPRHRVYVNAYALASRLVTNAEFLAFIEAGGYERAEFWLSDGWRDRDEHGVCAPLYWERREGDWWVYTLGGMRPLRGDEPVCHISYYEADAYARWCGKRLPTEAEWEVAAGEQPVEGNFYDSGVLHPLADAGQGQFYGDVWEWTASDYSAYPGYRAPAGALGEYNGKFMCNQQVLRGGSCVSSRAHLRATYRNFFYPNTRWQFAGVRLADDV